MVITFAPDVVADRDRYREAATLPADALSTLGDRRPAAQRRDAAVESFNVLRGALGAGDRGPLEGFLDAAAALVASNVDDWRARWEQGPRLAAETTGRQLDALARADGSHLSAASIHELPPPPDERRMGCCGTLGTYVIAET